MPGKYGPAATAHTPLWRGAGDSREQKGSVSELPPRRLGHPLSFPLLALQVAQKFAVASNIFLF